MGSATVSTSTRHAPAPEVTTKRSLKDVLKNTFHIIFQKSEPKRKPKENNDEPKIDSTPLNPTITPIISLLKNSSIGAKQTGKDCKSASDCELDNFEYVDRCGRIDSESSNDSGFSDNARVDRNGNDREIDKVVERLEGLTVNRNGNGREIEVVEGLQELRVGRNGNGREIEVVERLEELRVDRNGNGREIEEVVEGLQELRVDGKKTKRLQTVYVTRAPVKTKHNNAEYKPYQQISQVNKQTFSGGQVIVKSPEIDRWRETPNEIDLAISQIDSIVHDFAKNSHQEQVDRWNIAQEFITENQKEDFLDKELENFIFNQSNIPNDNSILDFVGIQDGGCFEIQNFANPKTQISTDEIRNTNFENDLIFDEFLNNLTPPRSNENTNSSPVPTHYSSSNLYYTPPYANSISSGAYNSPSPDFTLSPERSSPNDFQNSDFEKCQDLPVFDDIPVTVKESKPKDKLHRSSSINMKTVKDILKRLNMDFSKAACCKKGQIDSKTTFHEHFQKFSIAERKTLCLRVTNLDLNTTYGVLQNIIVSLASPCERESLHYALFSLVCERVLAQAPALFLGDFGLNLLKAAALRCPSKPVLVRYVVRCVHRALATERAPKREADAPLYTEVDALGENLIGACARSGDRCADVLAELVKREGGHPPLFDVTHRNTEGYTALHVACLQDMASEDAAPRRCLRTLHVLLAHANVDLSAGDTKGGDTALHLTVNSARCSLELVLSLMAHAPRAHWKQLAHAPNRSSVTPLEYARSATKSQPNYPIEILDFLKKCR